MLSLAILERHEDEIRYLYQSSMFQEFMRSIQLGEESAHTPHYERRLKQHRRMVARMMDEADRTGREVYTDFITHNAFNSMRLHLVTRDAKDTRTVFLMATVNISRFSPEAGSMQESLNQIVALYDRIDLYDLETKKVTQLYREVCEPRIIESYGHFEEFVRRYAEEMLLPAYRSKSFTVKSICVPFLRTRMHAAMSLYSFTGSCRTADAFCVCTCCSRSMSSSASMSSHAYRPLMKKGLALSLQPSPDSAETAVCKTAQESAHKQVYAEDARCSHSAPPPDFLRESLHAEASDASKRTCARMPAQHLRGVR